MMLMPMSWAALRFWEVALMATPMRARFRYICKMMMATMEKAMQNRRITLVEKSPKSTVAPPKGSGSMRGVAPKNS